MSASYLGMLDISDPLHKILSGHICSYDSKPVFHVHMMSRDNVYKYIEESTSTAVIGKFFRKDDPIPERARRRREEFENLCIIRKYGFDSYPHYVVRPLGRDETIGLAVFEEFISGPDLDYYLGLACREKGRGQLLDILFRLASFLHSLHKKTAGGTHIELSPVSLYSFKIIEKLSRQGVLTDYPLRTCLSLIDAWLKNPALNNADSAILHGDATPTNFLFTKQGDVVAIDLERMKWGDIAFDLGMICGELKHSFMWRTGDKNRAEPFIHHFLKSYAEGFPCPEEAFGDISRRIPYYMALTELRIARNGYLDLHYRKQLIHESMECLKWGLINL